MEEKNGKLERAIIRQRFEKEQLVTKNREEMVGFDEDLRSLVREQVSHISDLQKEVNTLRSALKDSWRAGGGEAHGHGGANVHRNGQLAALSLQAGFRKAGGCDRPKRSPRRASLDQETIRLTKAAAAVTDVKGDDKDGARDELQKARYEIDVGARRIAQLEKWLDEIYNDRELGLGPGGKDVVGARAAVQQRPRGNVAAAAGLVALPDLTQPSLGGRPRGELHSEKPVWDFRTKLTAAVSKSAVHA